MFGQMWRNLPGVTKNLIIINLLVFVASMITASDSFNLIRTFGLYYPASENFEPYQIITSMFTHGGLAHVFFNMFALFMFGSQLERVWGPKKFLFFYFATGIGASALHMSVQAYEIYEITGQLSVDITTSDGYSFQFLNFQGEESQLQQLIGLNYTPTVGASGAIYGLLLGFAMLFPNMELMLIFLPIPIKAKYFVPVLMLFELYLGFNRFSGDNIAHFAHLGGALFGFIIIKIWQYKRTN